MIYKQLLTIAIDKLRKAGIANAELDARLLLEYSSGLDRAQLFVEQSSEVSAIIQAKFNDYLARRLQREPVARIKAVKEFWSLEFDINPFVLDPRPDSETLIEAILSNVDKEKNYSILDMGTGSGCLIISLLSELKYSNGLATDISNQAIEVAKNNAIKNKIIERIKFKISNWGSDISGKFDIIISNPPYIRNNELLEPEVKEYDPNLALFGGDDGLECYRKLIPDAARLLVDKGMLAVEIGYDQFIDVKKIFEINGFENIKLFKDLGGNDRVILAQILQ